MAWMCPNCDSQNLKVGVIVHMNAPLIQEKDGNFQTEDVGGDHEWDSNSDMECGDCGHADKVKSFEVPDDYPALRELAKKLARMNYDGEELESGYFVMENDDAVSTLSETIREAREIVE